MSPPRLFAQRGGADNRVDVVCCESQVEGIVVGDSIGVSGGARRRDVCGGEVVIESDDGCFRVDDGVGDWGFDFSGTSGDEDSRDLDVVSILMGCADSSLGRVTVAVNPPAGGRVSCKVPLLRAMSSVTIARPRPVPGMISFLLCGAR